MLKKLNRLSSRSDWQKLYHYGRKLKDDYLTLIMRPNQLAYSRVAIVVSTKIAKSAVKRNRIRRRLRAMLNTHFRELQSGIDLAIVVSRDPSSLAYVELEKRLLAKLAAVRIN